jgi:hypothetical protein
MSDNEEPRVIVPAPAGAEQLPNWRRHVDANTLNELSILALDESVATERKFLDAARQRSQAQNAASEAAFRAALTTASDRQHLDASTEDELRQDLLDTILGYDNALMRLGMAEATVARAKQRMEEADAELTDYADLEANIVEFHTDQIRRNRNDELPLALANAERARARVIDRLDACHKAHQQLEREWRLATQVLASAAAQRDRAAVQVIQKSTDRLAEQLELATSAVLALRQQLRSAGAVWLPSVNGPLPLSKAAKTALRPPVEPKPDKETEAAYRTWHRALINDADAQLDEP